MADDLREVLDLAKRNMDDVPPEVWARFEQLVRLNFGASRLYIASQKKGRHLALLESLPNADADALAQKLGVSVRHARRLKRLG